MGVYKRVCVRACVRAGVRACVRRACVVRDSGLVTKWLLYDEIFSNDYFLVTDFFMEFFHD